MGERAHPQLNPVAQESSTTKWLLDIQLFSYGLHACFAMNHLPIWLAKDFLLVVVGGGGEGAI